MEKKMVIFGITVVLFSLPIEARRVKHSRYVFLLTQYLSFVCRETEMSMRINRKIEELKKKNPLVTDEDISRCLEDDFFKIEVKYLQDYLLPIYYAVFPQEERKPLEEFFRKDGEYLDRFYTARQINRMRRDIHHELTKVAFQLGITKARMFLDSLIYSVPYRRFYSGILNLEFIPTSDGKIAVPVEITGVSEQDIISFRRRVEEKFSSGVEVKLYQQAEELNLYPEIQITQFPALVLFVSEISRDEFEYLMKEVEELLR